MHRTMMMMTRRRTAIVNCCLHRMPSRIIINESFVQRAHDKICHFGAQPLPLRHYSASANDPHPSMVVEKETMKRRVLGIETSCDDTGVALVDENGKVLSERLITHYDIVKQYGGVYPDQVAKCHEHAIGQLIQQVIDEYREKRRVNGDQSEDDWMDAIAVTCGPGLNPCLKVGIQAAKKLSREYSKPVIAINHLEAHLLSPRMFSTDIQFPYLTMLVSGGHCLLVHTKELGSYEILVTTNDDSIGEAFDKVARLLDIDYGEEGFKSAGAALEHKASLYHGLSDEVKQACSEIKFAVPLRNRRKKDAEYSFSGLKANVLRCVRILEMRQNTDNTEQIESHMLNQYISQHKHIKGKLTEEQKICIAYEFQNTAFTHLIEKTELAISKFNLSGTVKDLVVCGGVAANQLLRRRLEQLCMEQNMQIQTPPIKYCTDNGVMVAWAGMERCLFSTNLLQESVDSIDLRGRWPLNTLSNQRNYVKEEK